MSESLPELYEARFDEREVSAKDAVWREIVTFLQRYIDAGSPVLDIACDRGHFIRWAVLGPSAGRPTSAMCSRSCRPTSGSSSRPVWIWPSVLPGGYFGSVFMSNYLEHLDSSDAVIDQLRVARQLLRPGGRVVVLQPNIRLVGPRYWDFIDHKVELTERSLLEAAELAQLHTIDLVTRFLPYSTKGRLPAHPWLVRA